MRDLKDMMRPHLYNPDRVRRAQHSDHLATSMGLDPADVIRLNANENPYDPLPEITDALEGFADPRIPGSGSGTYQGRFKRLHRSPSGTDHRWFRWR